MQMLGMAGSSGMVGAGREGAMDDSMEKTEAQSKGGFDLSSILMGQTSPTGGKAWASPNQAAEDPTASKFDPKQLFQWMK